MTLRRVRRARAWCCKNERGGENHRNRTYPSLLAECVEIQKGLRTTGFGRSTSTLAVQRGSPAIVHVVRLHDRGVRGGLGRAARRRAPRGWECRTNPSGRVGRVGQAGTGAPGLTPLLPLLRYPAGEAVTCSELWILLGVPLLLSPRASLNWAMTALIQ